MAVGVGSEMATLYNIINEQQVGIPASSCWPTEKEFHLKFLQLKCDSYLQNIEEKFHPTSKASGFNHDVLNLAEYLQMCETLRLHPNHWLAWHNS